MQLQLGSFRFEAAANTETALQEITRSRRWVQRQRFGRPPALEDHGRAATAISVRGRIPVRRRVDLDALDTLRTEAGLVDTGADPQPLTLFQATPAGMEALGAWTVERLVERRTGLRTTAGIPTVIEFELSLVEAAP